ncbi:hypothetical protein KP003_17405 [Geomonas nitrogeniifigens]|uniref:Uncharacterized protein n=1 Tax=Geomonas diazotrophica TaxID=2843197 RepID=A0ABX8JGQ6_9BACT|nr:hypothetical protein [Geomonas nitrogeniifigens]QWV96943.1 hypothetical protein KP005_16555 [Geomonas nitrogeniifigens]QXE86119.1 hypothetical protein KP003_17405 [Geomonas nitrogeniifigens]
MSRSILSYIYPPGCFALPEIKENRCPLCGNFQVDCSCTECQHPVLVDDKEEKCGVQGCLEHLLDRELVARIEMLESQLEDLREEARKRERPTPPCPVCGEVLVVDIYNSGPYSCHGHFYAGEKYGWIKRERY